MARLSQFQSINIPSYNRQYLLFVVFLWAVDCFHPSVVGVISLADGLLFMCLDLVAVDAVFLNVSELSGQSQRFGQRLREAVEIALEQGDEDLLTVDVARLFLDKETEEMMDAFRRYCVRSGEASLLLSTLEKERELLRIFLRASQLENPALRRMDLHAFLMVRHQAHFCPIS